MIKARGSSKKDAKHRAAGEMLDLVRSLSGFVIELPTKDRFASNGN